MKKHYLYLAFFFLTQTTFAQTFSAVVNQVITDDGTTFNFNIDVTGLPNTIDTLFGVETVCLNLPHPYNSDMEVKLRAPDGTIILLFSGVGGGDDNFTNTCLGGFDYPPIVNASAPFTGTFASMGVLGNVNNGQNGNGQWQLIVHDTYPFADEGTLIDWSITFGNNPAQPYLYTSSNLPIVKLTTLDGNVPNEPKVQAHLQIIDNGNGLRNYANQTNYAYEGDIMVELQGFTGPSYPKKNYDFDLIAPNGDKIDTSLLGMPAENDWILKAEYLDHTLIKNTLTYEMSRRMGRYAPRTRFCELLLDGEYIGVFTLTEKIKRGANRVDIAKLAPTDISGVDLTGGYIIEMNINGDPADWVSDYEPINYATCGLDVEFKHVDPKADEIDPIQHDYIKSYVDSFEQVLQGNDFLNPETGYRKYISVKSFIDFLITNEFSVNYDSYGRSTYLYKEKATNGNQLKIGPPWDYDRAYNDSPEGWVWEITHQGWPFPFWWSKMWDDPIYRKELACRWFSLRQNTLSTPAFMSLIDSLGTELNEAQARNFTIWNDLGGQTYNDQIIGLKSYVTQRLTWIDETLETENIELPIFNLPADTSLCLGTTLNANMGGSYTYTWLNQPNPLAVTLTQSGVYTLKAEDANGCYTTQQIAITASVPDASFSSQAIANQTTTWQFTPNNTNATSYLWSFGDTYASTQVQPTYIYAAGGNYVVSLVVTDSLGCQTSSNTAILVNAVGIAAPANQLMLQVSPNPFQAFVRVQFQNTINGRYKLSLVDIWGREVYQQSFEKNVDAINIPTQNLTQGVYLLKIDTAEKAEVIKIIKR